MDGSQPGEVLKTNKFNFLFPLHSIGILLALFIIAGVYVEFQKDITTILVIGFALNAIPVVFLHTGYWIKNHEDKFIIYSNAISHWHKGIEKTYEASQIDKIKVYKSASLDKGGFPILAIEQYHYCMVFLKSGEEIYLTCLLSPRVDEVLKKIEGVHFERRKWLFNNVYPL